MPSLSEVIDEAKKRVDNPNDSTGTIHVVIGNESCDLDSVSCALSLAHYISENDTAVTATPILNCQREDLPLRQDIHWLLTELNIDYNNLIFLPEVNIGSLTTSDLKVTLVDHNTPMEPLRPFVTEIIDHHDDTGGVACPRVIEVIGSCSSLIGERLLGNHEYSITSDVATLLLAAILADTANLTLPGKVTDKDVGVAKELTPHVGMIPDKLFDKIQSSREDIGNLTMSQLLRKDLKKEKMASFLVGLSSIRSLLSTLVSTRDSIETDLQSFCDDNSLHLLVLLGIQLDPLRRQIALYQPPSTSEELVDSIAATLETDPALGVERIEAEQFDGIMFEQQNVKMSRKQILPLIRDCLSTDLSSSIARGSLSSEPVPSINVATSLNDETSTEMTSQNGHVDDDSHQEIPPDSEVTEGEKDNRRRLELAVDSDYDSNKMTDSKEDLTKESGSLLQLESISARLGESMDSFALAQDSDEEDNAGRSRSPSPSASLTNIVDQAERSLSSIEEHSPILSEDRPPPPLEPNITIADSSDPLEVSQDPLLPPAVLPDEPNSVPIREYTSQDESEETRLYRYISIDGEEHQISLQLIQPYRNIIKHGGYTGERQTAVVVISAFYLPPKSLRNYPQVISQTFFYMLSVLDKLVVDDYIIVYLHSGAPRNSMPGIQWFHKFYRMIDRRLRKNLSQLLIVHPTFWVKTMLKLARPIISGKFYRKISFISGLQELSEHVKLDAMLIPSAVKSIDQRLHPQSSGATPG